MTGGGLAGGAGIGGPGAAAAWLVEEPELSVAPGAARGADGPEDAAEVRACAPGRARSIVTALLELEDREPDPAAEAMTAALGRVASSAPPSGEDARIARMRAVVAAYLALRLEVHAGMARITME